MRLRKRNSPSTNIGSLLCAWCYQEPSERELSRHGACLKGLTDQSKCKQQVNEEVSSLLITIALKKENEALERRTMRDVYTQWVVLGLVRNNIEGEEWEKECSR